MKIKTTKKNINTRYNTIISVGYADLQHSLKCIDATFYNSGMYGWNCDYYIFDGVCICTGYRPNKSVNTTEYYEKNCYEICKQFEKKATEILQNNVDYEIIEQLLTENLKEFVKIATEY